MVCQACPRACEYAVLLLEYIVQVLPSLQKNNKVSADASVIENDPTPWTSYLSESSATGTPSIGDMDIDITRDSKCAILDRPCRIRIVQRILKHE